MTQSSSNSRPCAHSKKLSAAFLLFLAACSPIPVWGQSTARLSALTPSVFQASQSQVVQQPSYTQPATQGVANQGAATRTVSHAEPVAATANTSAIHNLQYISGESLTQKMVAGLGDKLQVSLDNGIVRIQLPETKTAASQLRPLSQEAKSCELLIDRSSNRYALQGTPQSVANWSNLLSHLDSLEAKVGNVQFMMCEPFSAQELPSRLASAGVRLSPIAPATYQLSWNSRAAISNVRSASWQDETQDQDSSNGEASDNVVIVNQDNENNQDGQNNQAPTQLSNPSGVKLTVSQDGRGLIIEGTEEEIRQFQELFAKLQEISELARPDFDTVPLQYANNQNLAPVLQQLYNDSFAPTLGPATISAVPGENSLVISGSKDAIAEIKRVAKSLDVESDISGIFKVLRPQYISAASAANRLAAYFNAIASQPGANNGGQNNQNTQPVLIIPDPRSNSVIIKAGSGELAQAELLLKEIDIIKADNTPVHTMKTIQLRNSEAATMATVIQNAINGQVPGAPPVQSTGTTNPFGGGGTQGAFQANADPSPAVTGLELKLVALDEKTGIIKSGILFDVQILPDPTSNSLVIRGPAESLPLVEELIAQLDRLPNATSKIKVFTIYNGDATQLYDMLTQLFQQNQQQGGGGFNFGGNQNSGLQRLPLQSSSTVQTLVNLRFTLEPRTNSIIASGSDGDLQVVEDLLTLLDRESSTRFIHKLVRLSNLPAEDMATALNNWITARSNVFTADPATAGENVVVRQQIVVTPEPVSNTLMITASPENMIETLEQIRKLDRRPPMVQIKVMIAEVTLGDTEEFGIQFGVQDSILFDRGIASGIGYNFNQAGIGNSLDATGLAGRENLAGQGLVNLGLGRSNTTLGYGGLVLSAGNESISVLLRALKDKQRLRTLSNPVLMTIDNLQARVQVGQKVPYVTGVSQNQLGGFNNQVTLQDVGVILDVVPRVSPDGMITMLVNAQNSNLGSEADGTQIAVDAAGNAIRQRPINITLAVTTVLARSGQTVMLGGLIRDQKNYQKRGVPYLSDLPRLGPLFSFQSETEVRTELLFFLTPTLVEDDTELACTNQAEFDRMNWCMEDVLNIHGPIGVTDQGSFYNDSAPVVVYPDITPTGPGVPVIMSHGQGVEPVPGQFDMMNVTPSSYQHMNSSPLIPAPVPTHPLDMAPQAPNQ